MNAKDTIPLISVRPAFLWQSYSSAEEAVSAGENDRRETMARIEVSVAVGSSINAIKWSGNHLALSFANNNELFLTATAKGISLSSELNFPQALKNSDTVFLRFESLPEPIRWDRRAVLEARRGTVFCGLQISGGTAFVYTQGNEPLMLSTLEIITEDDAPRLMLYWDDED